MPPLDLVTDSKLIPAGVAVGKGVHVADTITVAVGDGVGDGVKVGVAVGTDVSVGVAVAVGKGVFVGTAATMMNSNIDISVGGISIAGALSSG